MCRQILYLVMFLCVHIVNASESVVEIIQINNRPAEELKPLLEPLLEPSDQIVANGSSLIVKTQPERLQTITNLIRKLDSPVNNLLISVIQSRQMTAEQLNAELSGNISIQTTRPNPIGGRGDGYYNQYQGTNRQQNTQTIRTQDGTAAFIKAGNAYPMTTYQAYATPYGYAPVPSTQYVEASTGFAVTPQLSGKQVTLDVSPWSGRPSGQGQFQVQEAQTSIRTSLGEWVEIGGVDESSQSSGAGTFAYNNQSGQSRLRILVKVDVVN